MHSCLSEDDIKQIIVLYQSGNSIRQIEKVCKVKRTRIGTILKINNVKRKSCGNAYKLRKYTLNEKFFDRIDTEIKAYWLGFIIADGHVSDDGLIIGLAIKDEKHLLKLLNYIQSNTKVKYDVKTKSCRIELYSRDLVKSLRKLGLFKDKSLSAKFPKIKKKLINHFIRGLMDGDGSISVSKNKYLKGKNDNYSIKMCGTEDIVSNFKKMIIENVSVTDAQISIKKNGFCQMGWGGNINTLKILNWIYKNSSIHLDRKYDRYLNLKNL